jgi:hypothetical protein
VTLFVRSHQKPVCESVNHFENNARPKLSGNPRGDSRVSQGRLIALSRNSWYCFSAKRFWLSQYSFVLSCECAKHLFQFARPKLSGNPHGYSCVNQGRLIVLSRNSGVFSSEITHVLIRNPFVRYSSKLYQFFSESAENFGRQ